MFAYLAQPYQIVLDDRPSDADTIKVASEKLEMIRNSLGLDLNDFKWVVNRIWKKWHASESE